jgi:hypothetical protein
VGLIGSPPEFNPPEILGGTQARYEGFFEVGSTTGLFFASWASPLATDGSLFLRGVVGEGPNFVFADAVIVPEPAAGLLLWGAWIALAARSALRARA